MDLDKKRWGILAICCIMNLCMGSIYAFSVFSAPFAAQLTEAMGREVTAADLSVVFTLANSISPVTLIAGGFFNDKIGARWVIFAGGLLFGGGLVLSGFSTSIAMLSVTFGLMTGLAFGLVYGCAVNGMVKFFPDRRGMVGGVTVASYGLSSVLMPPVANRLIEAGGITQAVITLGIFIMAVICAGAFFIPKCPTGYSPAGWRPQAAKLTAGAGDKNFKEMLGTARFYIMLAILLCGTFSGLMLISQAKPMSMEMVGLNSAAATTVVSVLALFNTCGRVTGGVISDKIGRVNTIALAFVLSIAGALLLFFTRMGGDVQFYLGSYIVGLSFGGVMGVFPGFTADQFGAKNNSVNFGFICIGLALGSLFGPMALSSIYTATGSYRPAFVVSIICSAAGLLLTFIFRAAAKKAKERAANV